MLTLRNGDCFASGVLVYDFKPLTPEGVNNRILLEIVIDDIRALAAIDTGAPYLIVAPYIASQIGIDLTSALEGIKVKIRGVDFSGYLCRVGVTFPVTDGESQAFEATAFIPLEGEEEKWGNLPSFLGFEACLDRVRFAIDPSEDKIYIGPLP